MFGSSHYTETLESSFSAVSTPTFARKRLLSSIRLDLHHFRTFFTAPNSKCILVEICIAFRVWLVTSPCTQSCKWAGKQRLVCNGEVDLRKLDDTKGGERVVQLLLVHLLVEISDEKVCPDFRRTC